MKSRPIFRFVILLCLALASCRQNDHLIDLKDGWELAEGFNKTMLTASEGSGTKVTLPNKFSGIAGRPVFRGWMTLRHQIPEELMERIRKHETLAMSCVWPADVSEYYVNEHLIGSLGSAAPYRSGNYLYILKDIPSASLKEGATNYLTIALYSQGELGHEIARNVKIGPADEIYQDFYFGEFTTLSMIVMLFTVGAYHLALGIKRPKDIHNLYFGFFAITSAAYFIFRSPLRDVITLNHLVLRTRMEFILLYAIGPLLLFFLTQFFWRGYTRLSIVLSFFWGTLAVVTALTPSRTVLQLCLSIWQFTALPAMVYAVYIVIREVLRKNKDAMYLVGGVIVMVLGAAHDIASSRRWIDQPDIGKYSFALFLFGIAGILANRFGRTHNDADRLNIEIMQKNTALSQLDKLKDEFLANTSHELRTPLNGIIGLADSMIDGAAGPLNDVAKRNLGMIASSGKRLAHLVNDILDFSRLRNKDIELQKKAVDLRSMSDVIVALSQPLLNGKELTITNDVPADLPAVDADENRVQQILHNLVGNAIKFTEKGEVKISAKVVDE